MHRARLVTRVTILKFQHKPANALDSPAPLHPSHGGSADFLAYSTWLTSQLQSLRNLPLVSDKDADARLSALMKKIKKEIARLAALKQWAWQKEMVTARLVKNTGSVLSPITVPGGM